MAKSKNTPMDPVETMRARIRHMVGILKMAGLSASKDGFKRLIRDGTWFRGYRHVKDDPILKVKFGRRRFKPKECFANAQTIVLDDAAGHAVYHEGFFKDGASGGWVLHAWVVVGEVVIDPTLAAAEKWLEENGLTRIPAADHEYFGVAFDSGEVLAHLNRDNLHSSILALPISSL